MSGFADQLLSRSRWKNITAAAAAGDLEARWELGYYYEYGAVDKRGKLLVPQDHSLAVHWYTLAAKSGNLSAQCSLGRLLSDTSTKEFDSKQAVYWSKCAIRQGASSAASNLGKIYRDRGKPKQAFRWYQKALAMGDGDVLLDIALCYFFGFGVKQNLKLARRLLKQLVDDTEQQVCERTVENGLYWLGVLCLSGMAGGRKSVTQARHYLELANKDSDHEQANELLNLIGKTRYHF